MQDPRQTQATGPVALAPRLAVDYFDGRSARAQQAEIWLGDGQLHLHALSDQRYPVQAVRWPERQRHGQRQAQLPDGGVLSCACAADWDAWARASGLHDSITVRWMQSWRYVALSFALLVALLTASWRWGAPLATELVLRVLPQGVEQRVGAQALDYLDRQLLKPTALPAEQRQQISERFAQMVTASDAQGPASDKAPAYRLHFRAADKALGPNAFALPGGDIVMTDALVELMRAQPDAVLGVLAHELGHVRHRHGMRMTVQASLLGALAGLVVGDFSSVIAGIPVLLAQQSYSRDFEREADEHARQMLRSAGVSPRVMVGFFERLTKLDKASGALPIAFSSHPANAERIAFFNE